MVALRLVLGLALVASVSAHGQLNYPPSTRQGLLGKTTSGNLQAGGYCEQPWHTQPTHRGQFWPNGACMMFSQPSDQQPTAAIIPGPPTLNASRFRTVNVNVSSGLTDWTRIMPWRSPGAAPVLGSGCGVAGGGAVWNQNGGWAPEGMAQGADAVTLPKGTPTVWKAGSTVEVAWAVWTNHGGGYQYRICKDEPGQVTEACFQATPLKFAGKVQWLHHINGSRFEIPLVKVTEGVTPAGSEWARNPFPECHDSQTCTEAPRTCQNYMGMGDTCHKFAFPEPLPNTHGLGHSNSSKGGMDGFHDYSIVDKVVVPKHLPAGDYLLSWRWDCEQSAQIWQNCADVRIEIE